jgi:ABC-type Fe3+/spermidine/putrescine transport system ATPase subunit
MPDIQIKNVTKKFGNFTAVDDVSLRIRDGEYATILGPSGCGKTTLLRTIAGLIKPTLGDILIDGKNVVNTPPEDRNIGYLFQNYSLFPHMTVQQNVSYGPLIKGLSSAEADITAENMLKLVKLLERAGFMPVTLSGGMQQRVALVRALAAGGRILFLDEPLSSLDPKVGVILRYEIKKISRKMGLTVLHVTHDQKDALSISDKVVIMKKGRVVQVGSPRDVYFKPETPYVAYFLGDSNFLKVSSEGSEAKFAGKTIRTQSEVLGDNPFLAIRPEKILFESRLENSFDGVVEDVNFMGATSRYSVNVSGFLLSVETSKHPEIKKGDEVGVYLPPEDLMHFSGFNMEEELKII